VHTEPAFDGDPDVRIRRLAEEDLDLMRAILGDPAMTEHLGGPQPDERIRAAHREYLADGAPGGVFAITIGDDPAGVGWIGYWETELRGATVWEAGLSVLPSWQGRGIGSRAFRVALDRAAAEHRHRYVHAFVGLDNGPSNRMCARLGFEPLGETDVEYPPGTWTRSNEWRIALWPEE
jgi:RimJ/RimL family protein N-acetyltransferase